MTSSMRWAGMDFGLLLASISIFKNPLEELVKVDPALVTCTRVNRLKAGKQQHHADLVGGEM